MASRNQRTIMEVWNFSPNIEDDDVRSASPVSMPDHGYATEYLEVAEKAEGADIDMADAFEPSGAEGKKFSR
ncbi:hypothetical protein LTS18_010763 [Coniosporium uncinatum]|uniref:Uncharacterized protein n=1 Tax=Coniosporium uncinatum TaxID=93489 RepID=A0ACC3CZK4_9PEZI|nr:hypothetical protein LTS18_010763 [Coniosporium uncinatum]